MRIHYSNLREENVSPAWNEPALFHVTEIMSVLAKGPSGLATACKEISPRQNLSVEKTTLPPKDETEPQMLHF